MDGSRDGAGIFFALLIVVLAIPFGFRYFRHRNEMNPVSRMSGMALLIAAVLDGGVNLLRRMGQMPDDALYWTLQISLVVLFWVMLLFFFRAAGQSQGKAL